MINNLADYFEPEQEYYLDNISYNRIESHEEAAQAQLYCRDNINANIVENGIQLKITRILEFEPKTLFTLSVSYGAKLKFNDKCKNEFDWKAINLEDEFRNNGQFVLDNLMNRISLLIAEITSSYGLSPLILFPGIPPKQD